MLHRIETAISQSELRNRVFSGQILPFPKQAVISDLLQSVQKIARCHLNSVDPVSSHDLGNHPDWLKNVYNFQMAARNEINCHGIFADFLSGLGITPLETFCDRFIFRVVAPQALRSNGAQAWVDIHRDT